MKTTKLANYFGLTVEETKEFLEEYPSSRVGKSTFTTLKALHPDGSETEEEVLDLIFPKHSEYELDEHKYFDKTRKEYLKDHYSDYYIREDEAIEVTITNIRGYGYKYVKTSQFMLDKLGVQKCSVCGCYEAYDLMFKHEGKYKRIRTFEGKNYCPRCLPEGTIRCHECGKIIRKEDAVGVYKDSGFPSYEVCSDCIDELVDDAIIAKCVNNKYYEGYGRYNGKMYPIDVYRAYKYSDDEPYWWKLEQEGQNS